MKTYELTFVIKSWESSLDETSKDIDGILQDAIKDCEMEYVANLIRCVEEKEN